MCGLASSLAGDESACIGTTDKPVHLAFSNLRGVEGGAADGGTEDDCQMLFVILRVGVEMEVHFCSVGCGDYSILIFNPSL